MKIEWPTLPPFSIGVKRRSYESPFEDRLRAEERARDDFEFQSDEPDPYIVADGGVGEERCDDAPVSASPLEAVEEAAPADSEAEEDATTISPDTEHALLELMREVDRLREEADDLRQQVRELEGLADADALLPVYNRRAFIRELERMISFSQRYAMAACVVYLDLDNFKQINDRFGHQAGDAVLLRVAETLNANVRQSDVVGRLGGDEFAVILATGGVEAAERKAALLAKRVAENPVVQDGRALPVGVTHGVYALTNDETAEQALARADAAMYAHKNSARPEAR